MTEFLEKRVRIEWLFEEHDLSRYMYHGSLLQTDGTVYYEWPNKALSNYLDLIDNRRQYRMALGKEHVDFSVTYTKIQCDYDPDQMKITVLLDEHIQYSIIPGNNAPSSLSDTFVITLTEVEGGWQMIDIRPKYDSEYESIKYAEYDKEAELAHLLAIAAEIIGRQP